MKIVTRVLITAVVLLIAAQIALVAHSAEPACVTNDQVLEHVRMFVSDEAAGAMMKPDMTARFATASGFPYPENVAAFMVVATPREVGVLAFDADGCAFDRGGVAAAEVNEVMLMLVSPDTLQKLLESAGTAL